MSPPCFVLSIGMGQKRTRLAAELVSKVKVWEFEKDLVAAKLNLREKRFLAHCELLEGGREKLTAHCPNPGAMLGFGLESCPQVFLSHSNDSKRKLPWTLETVNVNGTWVGCNTLLPNRVVAAALDQRAIPELQGYASVRSEVPYGREKSRVDFVLNYEDGSELFLEVKNVTLRGDDATPLQDVALFPDCKTERGQKHLRELSAICTEQQGDTKATAALLLFINRTDVSSFAPSRLDPVYRKLFYEALDSGVRVLPYIFEVDPDRKTFYLHPKLLPIVERDHNEREDDEGHAKSSKTNGSKEKARKRQGTATKPKTTTARRKSKRKGTQKSPAAES